MTRSLQTYEKTWLLGYSMLFVRSPAQRNATTRTKRMIDTHLYILTGVDDGPETIEEALQLARVLVQEGISTAIATPHYNDEFPRRSAAEIRERVADLQNALLQNRITLRLFAGHEALIKPGLVEDIRAGRLATLNGSR